MRLLYAWFEVANLITTHPCRPDLICVIDNLSTDGRWVYNSRHGSHSRCVTKHHPQKIQEFGMSMGKYCVILNKHLDDIAQSITHLYLDCVRRYVRLPKGTWYCCTVNKAKESIWQVYFCGKEMCFWLNLHRHQYNLAFPMKHWHLDRNHKLVIGIIL